METRIYLILYPDQTNFESLVMLTNFLQTYGINLIDFEISFAL